MMGELNVGCVNMPNTQIYQLQISFGKYDDKSLIASNINIYGKNVLYILSHVTHVISFVWSVDLLKSPVCL